VRLPDPKGQARPHCDALPTAVRVFTTRDREAEEESDPDAGWDPRKRKGRLRRYPTEALVFDTETTTDPAQRLLVGVWRHYRDALGAPSGTTCIEEGIFYPDDLASWDPDGFATLESYGVDAVQEIAPGFSRVDTGRRLKPVPLSWFLQERLFRYGYSHRNRCALVAFNLPFDLGRLASHWTAATRYYRGGFSLGIWGGFDEDDDWHDERFHPRLLYKAIDPRRTIFGWGALAKKDQDDWGSASRFVDLRTLSFALTDRSYDLVGACKAFGDPWEKQEPGYGVITRELLDYAREDVAHTATLYRNTMAELARHEGVHLDPSRLFSPASVGTAYLEAMGLTEPMEKFSDLGANLYGWSMSAFYGGRAEARIVRTEVPVTYVDAASMYPSVNALLDTWALLRARSVEQVEVTEEVRESLDAPDLMDRCLTEAFWRDRIGVTLVELTGLVDQILPVRAFYEPGSVDPGIGINPLTYDGTCWYMLPDVLASVLLSEKAPTITRAIRLVPRGIQRGLHAVKLRGVEVIDPRKDDPFVAMVQERRRVLVEISDTVEQERLERFLKITANATSYGVLARFDRKELASEAKILAHGPNPSPSRAKTKHPEDPGPYCFPPVAASLTAGARLILALLERAVTDAGGSYAFCDTDSMAIVASAHLRQVPCANPRGSQTIRALTPSEVQAILDRFADLNPYAHERGSSLWKVEHDSMKRPLWCTAISAKRYALYRKRRGKRELMRVIDEPEGASGEVAESEGAETSGLIDWSEHGIGLYLDPKDPDHPRRASNGQRLWTAEAWDWALERVHEEDPPEPWWASTYALTRFTVSGPHLEGWFSGYNHVAVEGEEIRPGCFGLIAHPFGDTPGRDPRPTAPYERYPDRWTGLSWYDREDGRPIRVHTVDPSKDPEGFALAMSRGDVRVSTLGDVLKEFATHAEHKSLAPDGSPATDRSRGLLRRRPVRSAPVITDLIGKEGNRILERATGEVLDASEYAVNYGARADRWWLLVAPALRSMTPEVVAERTSFSLSSVERNIREVKPTRPRAKRIPRYIAAAADWAESMLRQRGIEPSTHPLATLYCGAELGAAPATCECGCQLPLPTGRRRWYSDNHRKRAARSRV
jgi:hypothetical protein